MSDDAILDMIFNPGMDGVNLDMLERQPAPPSAAPSIDPELLSQLRTLEASAIVLAEGKDLSGALAKLDECIALCDRYASAFNNRAQVRQLMHASQAQGAGGSENAASAAPAAEQSVEQKRASLQPALDDLERALTLAESDPLVRRQALVQRALIRRALGEEEPALEDYRLAAALGSTFAKKEAVRLNPYAKLCNQYLQIAMENQWSGIGGDAQKKEQKEATGAVCDASSSEACKGADSKP